MRDWRIGTVLFLLVTALGAGPSRAAGLAECLAVPGVADQNGEGFTHRIPIVINATTWYLLGPELELPSTPEQAGQPQDLPGHCWKLSNPIGRFPRLIGKHYNTGPLAAGAPPRFWSSNAASHEQLFWVDVIISRWSARIAAERARDGYVHYHELVREGDGCFHPKFVAWLRHSAVRKFKFDGGPPRSLADGSPFRPRNIPHNVRPGLEYNFAPNYDEPYQPSAARQRFGRRACSN